MPLPEPKAKARESKASSGFDSSPTELLILMQNMSLWGPMLKGKLDTLKDDLVIFPKSHSDATGTNDMLSHFE